MKWPGFGARVPDVSLGSRGSTKSASVLGLLAILVRTLKLAVP